MRLAIPLVVLLGVVVVLLHRSGGMRVWQSVIVALFGFYLAESSAGGPANGVVNHFVHSFFHP